MSFWRRGTAIMRSSARFLMVCRSSPTVSIRGCRSSGRASPMPTHRRGSRTAPMSAVSRRRSSMRSAGPTVRIRSATNCGHPVPTRRLHRSITTLDQWWWRCTPPAPVCITNAASALGGYWSGLLGYQCDPDDPDAVPPAALTDPIYWIAPHGWWGWGIGGWPLTGFYNGGYPYWWRGFGFGSYWGAWGPGWWNYRWLGRPPSPDDVPDPDVPVSTVLPVGAALERLCRYAWVVWQWGYRVLDVDTDRQAGADHRPDPVQEPAGGRHR